MENKIKEFLKCVEEKKMGELGSYLSEIFKIDENEGTRSAKHFKESCQDDPDHHEKAKKFGQCILENSNMDALLLLQSCFGLNPFVSVAALDSFKSNLKN